MHAGSGNVSTLAHLPGLSTKGGRILLTSGLRFRWVSLQLQYLCTIKVTGLVEERLGRLPQDLRKIYEETYTERLGEYQDEEKALVQCALRWLLCSNVVWDTATFLTLISSSSYHKATDKLSRDALLDLCFHFIIHDAELDVFRFSHLSVREYLESLDSYQLDASHAFAAEYCLRLLTFELRIRPGRGSHLGTRTEDPPHGNLDIIKYAHFYWGHHLQMSNQYRFAEPLRTLFPTFAMNQHEISSYFFRWNWSIWSFLDWSWNRTLLRVSRQTRSSTTGLTDTASDPVDIITTPSLWDFEKLMERCSTVNSKNENIRNKNGKTALHVAWNRACLKAARLMIEQGVEPEATYGCWEKERTEMIVAASQGHADIVQIALENHADPCTINGRGLTALRLAAKQDFTDTTNLVIDLDAEVTGFGANSFAFFELVYHGHMDLVKALYKKTNIDETSQKRWLTRSALMRAIRSSGDMTGIFELDRFEHLTDQATLRAALFASLESDNVNAGRTLIAMGASANSTAPRNLWERNWWSQSPGAEESGILTTAIREKTGPLQTAFVKLLLDSGAFVDPDPSTHQLAPLRVAVESGNEAVVSMLLERNARLDRVDYYIHSNSESKTSRTASGRGSILDVAENAGQFAISQLLKAQGCVSAFSYDE